MKISRAAEPSCGQENGASLPQPLLVGEIGHGRHHEQGHDDAGNHAAEKQRADRDVRHHAVDHERQRRRDDRAERRGGRGHADGELGGVAVILHRLDFDGAEAGGIGDRGAGHAGKDHRADDIDVAEAAAHPAHQRDREFVDAARHAGDVHEIAGQNEERHGQQRKALDAGDHALRQRHVGRDAGDENVDQRRYRHGERDRKADQHQQQKSPKQQQHRLTLPFRRMRRGAPGSNSPAASSRPRSGSSARTSARSRAARRNRRSPFET